MSNRKIDQLPRFSGDTTGVHVVINNASNTTTYTVTKETFLDGNNTFHGNQVITGSLSVSGSTLQTGNNTLIGNTVLSGSLAVSGSNTFRGETKVTGAFFIASSSLFSQGTGSALVAYDTGSGQLYHTTYASAFPALMGVGAFYSTQTQSGSINQSGSFTFNNTLNVNTVNIQSGSRIVCDRPGVYNVQFSIQVVQGSGESEFKVWLKKNGTNVPGSATYITIPSNTKKLVALNIWDITTSTGDYFEIAYQSNDDSTTYQYIPATGNIPASPSIILTVNQVR
jgi:hypothetical protein